VLPCSGHTPYATPHAAAGTAAIRARSPAVACSPAATRRHSPRGIGQPEAGPPAVLGAIGAQRPLRRGDPPGQLVGGGGQLAGLRRGKRAGRHAPSGLPVGSCPGCTGGQGLPAWYSASSRCTSRITAAAMKSEKLRWPSRGRVQS
jgi:hypothetical protein